MKKENKTVQLTFRIDSELVKKLEFFADGMRTDKMSLIRNIIASFIIDAENSYKDAAIEDYIKLRIDEKELKDMAGMKTIPEDVQEARKSSMKKIMEKKIRE